MLSVSGIFESKRFYTPGVVGKGQEGQMSLPGSLRKDT